MIENTQDIILLIAFVSLLATISIFLFRLIYVRKAVLELWGVYLILELITTILIGFSSDLIVGMPEKKSEGLFENLTIIFQIAIILIMFHQQQKLNKSLLWAIFGLFFVVWVAEFTKVFSTQNSKVYHLQITPVLESLIIIVLVLNYLVYIYKNQTVDLTNLPFFWICIGLLVAKVLVSTSYFEEIIDEKLGIKQILFVVNGLGAVFELVCYSVGFWKTKNWYQNNRIAV